MIGQECTISAFQHVSIGRECIIADRVMLIDFDHGVTEVERPIRLQGIYKRDVRVGHNVWIGYGACILRGVTIGDNAIVGTSSVVTQAVARERRRRRRPRARDPHARRAPLDALGVSLRPGMRRQGGASRCGRVGVDGEVAQARSHRRRPRPAASARASACWWPSKRSRA